MTEQEIERACREMAKQEAPDSWANIEKRLQKREKKVSFFSRLKNFTFYRSTAATALAFSLLFMVCGGVLGILAGVGSNFSYYGQAGSSSSPSSVVRSSGQEILEENGVSADTSSDETYSAEDAEEGDTGQVYSASGRKFIRTIELYAETTTFDDLMDSITEETENAGGYIEYSNVSAGSSLSDTSGSADDRYASLTLRIPAEKTDDFLEKLEGLSGIYVTDVSESKTDVTLTYTDLESHIESLQTEKEELENMLSEAEDVSEILQIRSALTDVEYELNSYESQKLVYDNEIDYDTITLSLSEVTHVTQQEDSIGSKILEGLRSSLYGIGNFFLWILTHILYFVLLFAVLYLVIWLIKRAKNNKTEKKA